uniref:Uncharacterized protein n=1 Tax=Octopus bimaculoides TaxID=37653 RepID=A0A0L8FKN1_OCTBM
MAGSSHLLPYRGRCRNFENIQNYGDKLWGYGLEGIDEGQVSSDIRVQNNRKRNSRRREYSRRGRENEGAIYGGEKKKRTYNHHQEAPRRKKETQTERTRKKREKIENRMKHQGKCERTNRRLQLARKKEYERRKGTKETAK